MRNTDLEALYAFIQKKARGLESDAGFGGEMGDRGAQRLRDLWGAYYTGLTGGVPDSVPGLKESVQEFLRETDPEFAEYSRLKQKFG